MKKLTMMFIGILTCYFVQSQDKISEIKLNKSETLLETISLKDGGILLKVGEPVLTGKPSLRYLYYYNELVWERSKKMQYSPGLDTKLLFVSTPGGSYVYHVEIKGEIYQNKSQYITQINKNGELKDFEIKGREEFGKNLQAVFADDQNLYFLTTENGAEFHDKKKLTEKLILNRFNNQNFTYERILIETPALNGENTTFWSYIGQKDSEHYLVAKTNDKKTGIGMYLVIAINQEGKIMKQLSIELDLQDKFLRPGYHIDNQNQGHIISQKLDYEIRKEMPVGTSAGMQISSTNLHSMPKLTIGAFSSISFDPVNNHFYVFGLFGPKPFTSAGSVYEGFYIFKYNGEGKNIWQCKESGIKELTNDSFFRIHGAPSDRDISLSILPNQSINFTVHFRKDLFNFEISPDGKFLSQRRKEDYGGFTDNTINYSQRILRSDDYIEKNYSDHNKNVTFSNSLTSEGEVLFEENSKAGILKIMYWKN